MCVRLCVFEKLFGCVWMCVCLDVCVCVGSFSIQSSLVFFIFSHFGPRYGRGGPSNDGNSDGGAGNGALLRQLDDARSVCVCHDFIVFC